MCINICTYTYTTLNIHTHTPDNPVDTLMGFDACCTLSQRRNLQHFR